MFMYRLVMIAALLPLGILTFTASAQFVVLTNDDGEEAGDVPIEVELARGVGVRITTKASQGLVGAENGRRRLFGRDGQRELVFEVDIDQSLQMLAGCRKLRGLLAEDLGDWSKAQQTMEGLTLPVNEAEELQTRAQRSKDKLEQFGASSNGAHASELVQQRIAHLESWISVCATYQTNMAHWVDMQSHWERREYADCLRVISTWSGALPPKVTSIQGRAKYLVEVEELAQRIRDTHIPTRQAVGPAWKALIERAERLRNSPHSGLSSEDREVLKRMERTVPVLEGEWEVYQTSLTERTDFWTLAGELNRIAEEYRNNDPAGWVRKYAGEVIKDYASDRLRPKTRVGENFMEVQRLSLTGEPAEIIVAYFRPHDSDAWRYWNSLAEFQVDVRKQIYRTVKKTELVYPPREPTPSRLGNEFNNQRARLLERIDSGAAWNEFREQCEKWQSELDEYEKGGGKLFGVDFQTERQFISGVVRSGDIGDKWSLLRALLPTQR